jgi:hypothetical protein
MIRSRKFLALILSLALVITFVPSALAANTPQTSAADKLHTLGMLAGTGTNPDGSINFELGASINRAQAVTLIVNLLGKYEEATSQTWTTPFTDVPGWALPFVGYAYANKITSGTSETTFGSTSPVLPKQYLTFVLNALGYEPGVDFTYDKAWEKSDALGFTNGRINAQTTQFLRGDAISVTFDSLSAIDKATGKPLYEKLIAAGIFTKDLADQVGLGITPPPVTESKVVADIKAGQKLVEFGDYTWRVLSVEADKALLITDEVIADLAYDEEESDDVTWANSQIRQYLNTEFYDSFDLNDTSKILKTHLINHDTSLDEISPEYDTDDYIFLISADEANQYFTSDKDRVARISDQALNEWIEICKNEWNYSDSEIELMLEELKANNNAFDWWLRLIGPSDWAPFVWMVDGESTVEEVGMKVVFRNGVRPAFYINLKS